ncbi:MAG: NADH dehydrogenase [Planctomycetes bacterium GWF2_41_51]|nr:MAG: NADH dehydrogenase [Planctomycetes bacterium GWF2_41_51]HBG25727.1 NADH dehydrogenase FAD-containing subunit [Phycisphaerales bacterium]
MIWALILIPFIAGLLSLFIRVDVLRRSILIAAAVCHTAIITLCWLENPEPILAGWFAFDATAKLFLSIASVLFLCASFYAVGYLKAERHEPKKDFEEEEFFVNAPEAIFTACLLMFLMTMTLAITSQHFGLIWVAMEATTLVSAPLIYFHRHHRSLEATWKYLLICSVGIAISLLGNFFLAIAASAPDGSSIPLMRSDLAANASQLLSPWVKAAFIFILVGYGTKMGLAPLHTWLPDAHSEAPSVVSALLSGTLLNCAFVGILRAYEVTAAAGLLPFAQNLLILFGLVSMAFAAVFIIGQADYKRMLAYSSVEHMGILALGVGLGGAAVFGSMLHTVNHSLTKAALFLVAGNILAVYKTKIASHVKGVFSLISVSGFLWIAGILAITGFPPFGTFLSEFTILKAIIEQGRYFIAAAYLGLLAIIFVSFSAIAFRMAQGRNTENLPAKNERWLSIVPPAVLLFGVLVLGVYVPKQLTNVLHDIALLLGGN